MTEAKSGTVEPLDATEAPNIASDNRLLVTFRDDNSFDGMKIEVVGVTSLQIVAAIYHLSRIANAMDDAQMREAARQRAETDAILADLNAGRGPRIALPGRGKGRN